MADENELRELRERISRLRLSDQLYLFELVLSDYRAACAFDEEAGKRELAAMEEWHKQRRAAPPAKGQVA
jgi:hypothetical protein